MLKRIKNILFVACIVMLFTAQAKRPADKGQQHAPAVHNNQARPQVEERREAPEQAGHMSMPRVNVNIPQPLVERRESGPRVYAVPEAAPADNNRFLGRHHHNHWQPLYNFYNDQYNFYPYVNVTSPVELSADYVTVLFDGQTYFYDRGLFYVQDPQGYLATPPPIGIIVPAIPQHARQIDVDGQTYYRYKGVFYVEAAGGYQVVAPVQPGPDGS